MARPPPSFFTNLGLLRKNPKPITRTHRSLIISTPNEPNTKYPNHIHHKPNSSKAISEIAQKVWKVVRTRARWEQTLLSDFPDVNFADPRIYSELLMREKSAFLLLRFYYFLSSQDGFLPDHFSCNVIFGNLVEAKAVVAARNFLDANKFTPEPEYLELYIMCLCENGLVDESLDVFDQLREVGHCPSLRTWNSAFLGAIRIGRVDVVWKLYGDMMELGVVVDEHTIGQLVQAFCMDGNVLKGYELVLQALDAECSVSTVAINKLIYELCKSSNYDKVSALLHAMIAKNRYPDVFTYQEVIHGLCKRRMKHEAFRIFNDLKDRGYVLDRVMYTTMIHGLCKMNWLGDARKLWFEMIHKGFTPNEYTYSALIYGLWKTGSGGEAEKLFTEMRQRGLESTASYNTMINGFCSHGKLEAARGLYEEMVNKGICCDLITYNSLIQGFCKNAKIAEGTSYLYELLKQGLQPSTASYTVLLEKLCEVGRVEEAKTLWKDMQERGIKPAICGHDSIIVGLTEQGHVTEGIEWLGTMLSSRLKPQQETFEILVYHLSETNKFSDAFLVLDYMLKVGYALTEVICNSLVNKLCQNNFRHVETCITEIVESS